MLTVGRYFFMPIHRKTKYIELHSTEGMIVNGNTSQAKRLVVFTCLFWIGTTWGIKLFSWKNRGVLPCFYSMFLFGFISPVPVCFSSP